MQYALSVVISVRVLEHFKQAGDRLKRSDWVAVIKVEAYEGLNNFLHIVALSSEIRQLIEAEFNSQIYIGLSNFNVESNIIQMANR